MKPILINLLLIAIALSQQVYTNTGDTVGTPTGIWYNSSKVGIGTSSPAEDFHVKGTIRLDKYLYIRDFDNDTLYNRFISRDGSMMLWSGINGMVIGGFANGSTPNVGTDGLYVRANSYLSAESYGKVGIGTITPKYKLSVAGGIFNVEKNGDYYGFWVENKGRTESPKINLGNWYDYRGGIQYNSSGFYLTFDTQKSGTIYANTLVLRDGKVGVNTTSPDEELTVNGNIKAKKVKLTTSGWSDFVFDDDYELMSLPATEQFIKTNKHLPDIPSEAEVKLNGIEVGEMQARLLQKIEELTLHVIAQNKQLKQVNRENKALNARLKKLETEKEN